MDGRNCIENYGRRAAGYLCPLVLRVAGRRIGSGGRTTNFCCRTVYRSPYGRAAGGRDWSPIVPIGHGRGAIS